MRFWISGPRLFGGLIRPGVSFGAEDFGWRRSAPSPAAAAGGYCYVIRGSHGYVKVGSSVHPIRRLSDLQTGSPFDLELLNTIPVAANAAIVENEAHTILDRYRVRGEWFNTSPEYAAAAIYGAAGRLNLSLPTTGHLALQQEYGLREWATSWPSGSKIAAVVAIIILISIISQH